MRREEQRESGGVIQLQSEQFVDFVDFWQQRHCGSFS